VARLERCSPLSRLPKPVGTTTYPKLRPPMPTTTRGWLVISVLLLALPSCGLGPAQHGESIGPPHFVIESTQGVNPCVFPSQYWNGGSGTDVEWVLPAHQAPISSCSFTSTFKNTGGPGAAHVMFGARFGPESFDLQGYWHVRFIKDAMITCSADLPITRSGDVATVKCSLSTPDAGEYMGEYTYGLS
jgi:hypothetical protein